MLKQHHRKHQASGKTVYQFIINIIRFFTTTAEGKECFKRAEQNVLKEQAGQSAVVTL